jgi:hypothetical protein
MDEESIQFLKQQADKDPTPKLYAILIQEIKAYTKKQAKITSNLNQLYAAEFVLFAF